MKLSEFAERNGLSFSIDLAPEGWSPWPPFYSPKAFRQWAVTITRPGGMGMTLAHYHLGEPTPAQILKVLKIDVGTYQRAESFADWCAHVEGKPSDPIEQGMYGYIGALAQALYALLGPALYTELLTSEWDPEED
jgi:hypothetical protein